MNKKQFYYLTRIIEELLISALIIGVALYSLVPKIDDSFWNEIVLGIVILGTAWITRYRVKAYIKKAFDVKKPENDEQEDLKELEK